MPYFFVSSKYGFGIKNIFIYLIKVKILKYKISSDNLICFVKKLFLNNIYVKGFKILNYYPLLIEVYSKKNISYNYKKYLSGFFIKDLNLRNTPVKLIFR